MVVTFTPTTDGNQSSTVVLEDRKNTSIATAYVEGVGESAMPTIATTTVLAINPNSDLSPGESYTLTATVTPLSGSVVPSGVVKFTANGGSVELQLAYGKAVYTGTVPQPGTYSVSANYNGGYGFAGSRSNAITRTVTAPPSE